MKLSQIIRRVRTGLLFAFTSFSPFVLASQEQLVILTTFSSDPVAELMVEYKQQNPDIDIKLIHRRTQSAIALLNKSYIQDVDLVLSSSPFLMEELDKRGQLGKVSFRNEMPQWLMPFVLPQRNKVISVGYSGAGLVWNNDYLAANNLPVPERFINLTSFDYFGHITMSTPSRSGTTQMMIESILEQHGWELGWSIVINIGANLGTISSRSFSVSDYVAKGQFGIGPTIDSYALVLPKQFKHVDFGYDSDFTLMPTYIGVLKNSAGNEATTKFIDLLLSSQIQGDMAQTSFAKHSINDPSLYRGNNPALRLDKLMNREKLVNIIFDEAITKRLPELQDVWFSLSQFQQLNRTNAERVAAVNQLKLQLFSVPISEQEVASLGQSIEAQKEVPPLSNGIEQALLAEFRYRFADKFERNLDLVTRQLRQLQIESSDE